ncbi:MAG: hypothetical protein ABI408_00970 [Gemmatimonadaceae bacterium]
MAVKIAAKQDRRYFQDREGVFHHIENLSISASTPDYPAVLHQTRRTMILADDRSHAVIVLDKALKVSRNDGMSTVLVAYQEPTDTTWKSLEQHMEAEDSTAETARGAKIMASLERKKKATEAL